MKKINSRLTEILKAYMEIVLAGTGIIMFEDVFVMRRIEEDSTISIIAGHKSIFEISAHDSNSIGIKIALKGEIQVTEENGEFIFQIGENIQVLVESGDPMLNLKLYENYSQSKSRSSIYVNTM